MTLKCRQPLVGAGIGNVFALLWRRILDGKPGVQGEPSSPLSVFHRAEGTKLLFSISTQPTQVCNNKNLLRRQTWRGYPVSNTRVTSHLTSSARPEPAREMTLGFQSPAQHKPGRDTRCHPPTKSHNVVDNGVMRLSLGRRSVNLLPVAQRTNDALTIQSIG